MSIYEAWSIRMQSLREEMAALQVKIFALEKEVSENPDESKRDERIARHRDYAKQFEILNKKFDSEKA